MFRIDRNDSSLHLAEKKSLTDANIKECPDLQNYVAKNFKDVAKEIGEERLVLIGREVRPSDVVGNRIDLLAVGDEGEIVVIELKRANHKLQLLQTLAYAAMMSEVRREGMGSLVGRMEPGWEQELSSPFNQSQRLILIAEEYDYEVLITAQWLFRHDINVKCVKVALSVDTTTHEQYLDFSVIFPRKEIEEEAKKRQWKREKTFSPLDWDEVIAANSNDALKVFARKQLAADRERSLRSKGFYFRVDGSRRFEVWMRPASMYAEQYRRFDSDIEFWKKRLGPNADLHEVYKGNRLRFRLFTASDFAAFEDAIDHALKGTVWASNQEVANVVDEESASQA